MVSIKTPLYREFTRRRGETGYIDTLLAKPMIIGHLEEVEQLIEEVSDSDSNFYEDIERAGISPEEAKSKLLELYNVVREKTYEGYYNLPYGEGKTFGDMVSGNPVKWVENNIQQLYEDLLNGNPLPFINGMNIIAKRRKSVTSQNADSKIKKYIKNLISNITPNNEKWEALDKKMFGPEGVAEVYFLKFLQSLHDETEVMDFDIVTLEHFNKWMRRGNFDGHFINIMRIYKHMIDRQDSNNSGPLVDLYNGEDFEIKNSLIKKLLKSKDRSAVETLFNNFLTFRTAQRTTKGAGDILGNRNSMDWATEYLDSKINEAVLDYEDEYSIELAGVIVQSRDNEGEVTVNRSNKKKAIQTYINSSKTSGSTENKAYTDWKANKAPVIEDDLKGRTSREINRSEIKPILEKNKYMNMIVVNHRNLINAGNDESFSEIPDTYNFVYLDETQSSYEIKFKQFKSLLSLISKFNTDGLNDIQSVFTELEELKELEGLEYFEEIKSLIPGWEAQIHTGLNKLFKNLADTIKVEIVKVLSTVNPNNISRQKNFIKLTYEGKGYDAYMYLDRYLIEGLD